MKNKIPNKKVLKVQYPIIDTNPGITNLLVIIQNYPESFSWIFNNFVQLNAFKYLKRNYFDFWNPATINNCPFLNQQIFDYAIINKKWNNFIDFIIESINSKYYILLHLDLYYIKNSKKHYNKNHFIHETFIYGYDIKNRIIYIADFIYNDGKYSFITIDFDDIEKSYNYTNLRNYYTVLNKQVYLLSYKKNKYNFKKNIFIKYLQDYLNSENSFYILNLLYPRKHIKSKIYFGLNFYDFLIEYINELITKKRNFSIKPFHVLWVHKKVMLLRLEFLKNNNLFKNYDKIYSLFKELENKFLVLRNLFIKYFFSNKRDNKMQSIKKDLGMLKKKDKIATQKLIKLIV